MTGTTDTVGTYVPRYAPLPREPNVTGEVDRSASPSITDLDELAWNDLKRACPLVGLFLFSEDSRSSATSLHQPRRSDPFSQAIQNLRRYVRGLCEAGMISHQLAAEALDLWWKLVARSSDILSVPDASAGPNGELVLIWTRAEHYLSLQFSPDEAPEFFYRNRETGQIWGFDYAPDVGEIPPDLLGRLGLFVNRN